MFDESVTSRRVPWERDERAFSMTALKEGVSRGNVNPERVLWNVTRGRFPLERDERAC